MCGSGDPAHGGSPAGGGHMPFIPTYRLVRPLARRRSRHRSRVTKGTAAFATRLASRVRGGRGGHGRPSRPEGRPQAELLVSELVTNSLCHTRGPLRLNLQARDSRLRCEVEDTDPTGPVRRVVDAGAEGGRGIDLLDLLAEAWGSTRTGPARPCGSNCRRRHPRRRRHPPLTEPVRALGTGLRDRGDSA
jgi:hypothetical protein